MSNIVPSSGGSGFSKSELALIKNGQWLPELSHFIPITSPRNLDDNLNHARDEGEKIDLLIHTALNPHAPALVGLGEFLNSRDVTILAATLRGFASIGETLKSQNLDPDYRHHLEQIRYVLTANLDLNDDDDPSVHLFKRLCHDAESGGSEMVRWAAAHALQELDYPLNLRRQLLSIPPAEIVAEIWSRYESRLADSRRENDQSKVLEDIKFGIYGDTEKLFHGCEDGYALDIARQVLQKSGVRGIRLATKCENKLVVETAINFAGQLFNQIAPNSQDKRYVDPKTRQRLVDLLLPFIKQSDLELRNLVAEKLNDKRNNYKASNSITTPNYRAKVAVIDTDWNRAISLRDASVAVLCEAVQGTLRIEKNENLNTNCQLEAIKAIDKILTDVSRKVSILSPYLWHDGDRVRLEVAKLLQPVKSHLDIPSTQILTALLFTLNLPYESNISLQNEKTVEDCLKKIENHKKNVQDVFSNAISTCQFRVRPTLNFTHNFLSEQEKILLHRIITYSTKLELMQNKYSIELEIFYISKKIEQKKLSKNPYSDQFRALRELRGKEGIVLNNPSTLFWLCVGLPALFIFLIGYIRPILQIIMLVVARDCQSCQEIIAGDALIPSVLFMWFLIVFTFIVIPNFRNSSIENQISSVRQILDDINVEIKLFKQEKESLERKIDSIINELHIDPS